MKKKYLAISFLVVGAAFIGLTLKAFYERPKGQAENYITPNLLVFTYSSFLSHYGPGPALKKEFEKTCQCKVRLVKVGDAGTILQRMNLRPDEPVDIVVGLDQLTMSMAQEQIEWKSLDTIKAQWKKSIKPFVKASFYPYDWSPMTFIYRQSAISPMSDMNDLKNKIYKSKIAVQDPRSSTPGLQFLFWVTSLQNNLFSFLSSIKMNIKSVTPSWSASYGLFENKKVQVVFSYLTSLVYHWHVDKDFDYQAMQINQGHPFQVEYVAIPKRCKNCDLAKDFLQLMLSLEGQKIIAEKNFMLPVVQNVKLNESYSQLPKLKLLSPEKLNQFIKNKENTLETWKQVFE